MARGNETVIVVRPAVQDKFGTVRVPAKPDLILEGCQLVPRAVEEEGRGWITIDGWDIWRFDPLPEPIEAHNQVRVRGELHEIEGPPAEYDKRGAFRAVLIKTKQVG